MVSLTVDFVFLPQRTIKTVPHRYTTVKMDVDNSQWWLFPSDSGVCQIDIKTKQHTFLIWLAPTFCGGDFRARWQKATFSRMLSFLVTQHPLRNPQSKLCSDCYPQAYPLICAFNTVDGWLAVLSKAFSSYHPANSILFWLILFNKQPQSIFKSSNIAP